MVAIAYTDLLEALKNPVTSKVCMTITVLPGSY